VVTGRHGGFGRWTHQLKREGEIRGERKGVGREVEIRNKSRKQMRIREEAELGRLKKEKQKEEQGAAEENRAERAEKEEKKGERRKSDR